MKKYNSLLILLVGLLLIIIGNIWCYYENNRILKLLTNFILLSFVIMIQATYERKQLKK